MGVDCFDGVVGSVVRLFRLLLLLTLARTLTLALSLSRVIGMEGRGGILANNWCSEGQTRKGERGDEIGEERRGIVMERTQLDI